MNWLKLASKLSCTRRSWTSVRRVEGKRKGWWNWLVGRIVRLPTDSVFFEWIVNGNCGWLALGTTKDYRRKTVSLLLKGNLPFTVTVAEGNVNTFIRDNYRALLCPFSLPFLTFPLSSSFVRLVGQLWPPRGGRSLVAAASRKWINHLKYEEKPSVFTGERGAIDCSQYFTQRI